jgi:hypothetical protein
MAYASGGKWEVTVTGADTGKSVTTLRSSTNEFLTCSVTGTVEADVQISPDGATWHSVASLGGSNDATTNVFASGSYSIRPNVTAGTGTFIAR